MLCQVMPMPLHYKYHWITLNNVMLFVTVYDVMYVYCKFNFTWMQCYNSWLWRIDRYMSLCLHLNWISWSKTYWQNVLRHGNMTEVFSRVIQVMSEWTQMKLKAKVKLYCRSVKRWCHQQADSLITKTQKPVTTAYAAWAGLYMMTSSGIHLEVLVHFT